MPAVRHRLGGLSPCSRMPWARASCHTGTVRPTPTACTGAVCHRRVPMTEWHVRDCTRKGRGGSRASPMFHPRTSHAQEPALCRAGPTRCPCVLSAGGTVAPAGRGSPALSSQPWTLAVSHARPGWPGADVPPGSLQRGRGLPRVVVGALPRAAAVLASPREVSAGHTGLCPSLTSSRALGCLEEGGFPGPVRCPQRAELLGLPDAPSVPAPQAQVPGGSRRPRACGRGACGEGAQRRGPGAPGCRLRPPCSRSWGRRPSGCSQRPWGLAGPGGTLEVGGPAWVGQQHGPVCDGCVHAAFLSQVSFTYKNNGLPRSKGTL